MLHTYFVTHLLLDLTFSLHLSPSFRAFLAQWIDFSEPESYCVLNHMHHNCDATSSVSAKICMLSFKNHLIEAAAWTMCDYLKWMKIDHRSVYPYASASMSIFLQHTCIHVSLYIYHYIDTFVDAINVIYWANAYVRPPAITIDYFDIEKKQK